MTTQFNDPHIHTTISHDDAKFILNNNAIVQIINETDMYSDSDCVNYNRIVDDAPSYNLLYDTESDEYMLTCAFHNHNTVDYYLGDNPKMPYDDDNNSI